MENSQRVAYRLAYEEGIRWLSELDLMLERYRTRAVQFLAAMLIVAGVGLGSLDKDPPPCTAWLVVAVVGLAAVIASTVGLVWRVKGTFRLDPLEIVAYGDDPVRYPSDEVVYRDLAIWLANDNRELYRKINRRLWWLYVAVGGAVTMLTAIVALHWARLA